MASVPKNFVERCKRLCEDERDIGNPFTALRSILSGYKAVKPSDRLRAAEIILAYGIGKPKDTMVIEGKNPFMGVSDVELIRGLVEALGVEKVGLVLREAKNGNSERLDGVVGAIGHAGNGEMKIDEAGRDSAGTVTA